MCRDLLKIRRTRSETTLRRTLLLCLTACAALGFGTACGGSEGDSESFADDDVVTVEVTTVDPQLLRDVVALTGQLNAENQVVIKPEIEGVIESVEFVEGQPVSEGDVLFRMRDGEQRARLQEARAAVRLAQDVYDRTRRLASQDVSSVARRAEAVARLDAAKARLSLAEVELARTQILAPFDGVTGDRMTAVGDRVEQDIGLVSLAAIGRLQLVFTVPETGVAMASMGTPIQASVIAWPGERFPGEVFFVAPTIDPTSRRLVLKAWIANDDHRLKPGMFANVEVEIAKREDALLIPESSIVYDRNGTYIWRITEDDLAEKIPVKIGLRRSGTVEVVSGIADGDRVVSAGTHKVMAGGRVNAIEVDPIAQAVDEPEMSEGPGVSEDAT